MHSIILKHRTYLILQLPDGRLQSYEVDLAAQELSDQIRRWRPALEDPTSNEYLILAQQLYDQLIRPLEPALRDARPSTLTFVNDGLLRNVPMAALHDGQQFLVEKFPLSTSLGLKLTAFGPQQPEGEAALFGLSAAVDGFRALHNVEREVAEVGEIVGGREFLNANFTRQALRDQLGSGRAIVHLATHGQFGAAPSRTFVQAFDGRVSLAELEDWLSAAGKLTYLLAFSACDTAAGDDRSLLGNGAPARPSNFQSEAGNAKIEHLDQGFAIGRLL